MAINLAGTALKDFRTLKKHLNDIGFYELEADRGTQDFDIDRSSERNGNRTTITMLKDEYGVKWLLKLIPRYEQNIETLIRLMHMRLPNTAHIVRVGETLDFLWMIEEWVDGCTLDYWVVKNRDWAMFCKVISRLCFAIGSCHKERLLHLDLKQEHILINRLNDPILIDFGTCRSLVDVKKATQRDFYVTPCYSAPELLYEPWRVTTASDVYSLAIMLLSLCSHYREEKQEILSVLIQMSHQDAEKRLKDLELLEKVFLKQVI